MRTEQNDTDQVYKDLFGSSLIDGYRIVWRDHDYAIYASPEAESRLAAPNSAHNRSDART